MTATVATVRKKPRQLKGLIALTTILALVATGLMSYECYLPGFHPARLAGVIVWFVAGLLWVICCVLILKSGGDGPAWSRWSTLVVPLLAIVSVVARSDLSITLAIQKSEPELDRIVKELHSKPGAHAPAAIESKLQAGLFTFVNSAVDEKGGVYLVTATGRDGIGPDTLSWGLAWKPDMQKSPFGSAHYLPTHLTGNWYSFWASNDY